MNLPEGEKIVDRNKLTRNILIGMASGLLLGSLLHSFGPEQGSLLQILLVDGALSIGGSIFIASLKLLVVPLVFVSLVCGASSLGNGMNMGRLGGKTLGLYMLTTALAVSLALIMAGLLQPGVGVEVAKTDFEPRAVPSVKDVLVNIFPSNPIRAMADGNMLQIIVFALLVATALSAAGEAGQRVRAQMADWNQVIMRLVLLLMNLAPYGVFCLMASLFAQVGFAAIGNLFAYFFTVVLVLLLHAALTFSLLLYFVGGLNPLAFFRNVYPVMLYAFSTSSSNATMPVTLETVRRRLGVRNEVASFTVPLGATINMDGTAIMQGVATVFIAQYFAVDIGIVGFLTVVGMATLASIGTAGVPGVGLITLAMVLQQVGLPVEGIAMIIGVDRLLDMMRTSVNVAGDAMVSSLVAKSEGLFDSQVFYADNAEIPEQPDDTGVQIKTG